MRDRADLAELMLEAARASRRDRHRRDQIDETKDRFKCLHVLDGRGNEFNWLLDFERWFLLPGFDLT